MSRHLQSRLSRVPVVSAFNGSLPSRSFSSSATESVIKFKSDGSTLSGESFGSHQGRAGELVFSTGMTGYCESITDPSYAGQILTCTYPLIGNYGVPSKERDELGLLKYFESDKIHVEGLVVSEYSAKYSHCDAVRSLGDWLKEEGIPAVQGIDTRKVTKLIRDTGAQLVTLGEKGNQVKFDDPNQRNLVAQVSRKEPQTFGSGDIKIIAVDCGIKNNIIRDLARRGATVKGEEERSKRRERF